MGIYMRTIFQYKKALTHKRKSRTHLNKDSYQISDNIQELQQKIIYTKTYF